jgi:hypothetical protein
MEGEYVSVLATRNKIVTTWDIFMSPGMNVMQFLILFDDLRVR